MPARRPCAQPPGLGVPLLLLLAAWYAVLIATGHLRHAQAQTRAEARRLQRVDAVLTIPTVPTAAAVKDQPPRGRAGASWLVPSGETATGHVPAPADAGPGSTVAVWIDEAGTPTTRITGTQSRSTGRPERQVSPLWTAAAGRAPINQQNTRSSVQGSPYTQIHQVRRAQVQRPRGEPQVPPPAPPEREAAAGTVGRAGPQERPPRAGGLGGLCRFGEG